MPVSALSSIAKKSGKSLNDIERYWEDAKKSAEEAGEKDNYAYIMGIVLKRAGLESLSYKLDVMIDDATKALLPRISRVYSTNELQEESEIPQVGDEIRIPGSSSGKIKKISRGDVYIDFGKGSTDVIPAKALKKLRNNVWKLESSVNSYWR